MKYRVIKEMPGYRVGEICNQDIDTNYSYEWLCNTGQIEEVKEESLEDKFSAEDDGWYYKKELRYYMLAQIAKEHYLEVFDKATDEWSDLLILEKAHIRNALKEA